MIFQIYGRAFTALKKQPLRIWGLSLLGVLLICLGSVLFGIIPGVALSIGLLFSAALSQVFLRSYRGEQCESKDLFATFKNRALLKRSLGGMAWRELWIFIWALIPIVGIVFALIKTYTFALTPYILMNEKDVKPMDAIKVSAKRMKGYRGKMFWAEFLFILAFYVAAGILAALSQIPYIKYLFAFILFLLYLAFIAFGPLFLGLVRAAFYDEIMNPTIPLTKPVQPQPGPQQPYAGYDQQPYAAPVYPQQPYAAPVYPQQPYAAPSFPQQMPQQVPQQVPQQQSAPQPFMQAPYVPESQQPLAPQEPEEPTISEQPPIPMIRFCTECGTRFDLAQTNICPNCGKPIE